MKTLVCTQPHKIYILFQLRYLHCVSFRQAKLLRIYKICGVHQHGGMAEYLAILSYALVHGEGLSFDELALIEPLAIGAHEMRRAAITPVNL